MTPQEKAKELFNKFKPHAADSAKTCAVITVQEILNCNPHTNDFNTDVYSTYDYWFQVKQEIEKL